MICADVCKVAQGGNVSVMQTIMSLKGFKSTESKCANVDGKENLMVAIQELDKKIADMM